MRAARGAARAALIASLVLGSFAPPAFADAEEAQYNVVVSLYNAGQWQAAVSKIDERLKLELPDAMRARYVYAKGLAFERGQKTKEAHAAYDELLTKYPAAAEVHTARVAILYLDYAAGESVAVTAGYPKIDQGKLAAGDKRNLTLMYAESLATQGQAQPAVAAYKAAIAAGADAAPLAPRLFGLYHQLGMNADLLAASANGVTGIDADTLALVRAEAMLALNQFPQADAEAAKVRESGDLYPRASFIRAQSLIRQNKLREAAAPLAIAVARMKNPAAPPSARLALAECFIEAGNAEGAADAVAGAEKLIDTLPDADRAKTRAQASLIKVRLALASKDRKRIAKAVADARAAVPADQLPKLLYARLFALSEEGENKAIVQSMAQDLPVLQTSDEYGPSAMIFAAALRATGQPDEAMKVLQELIQKKPAAPEAVKARVVIANALLDKGDTAGAAALLDAVVADKQSPERLGKAAMDEVLFNRAVLAEKNGNHDAAIQSLTALLASTPTDETAKQAAPLLGQAYAAKGDFANAAATWKKALADGRFRDEADLRDRLSRAQFAVKDYAGVVEQMEAWSKTLKDPAKLPRESRELWARSLFSANRFADSAAMYATLAESHRDTPGYAYEAGVAYDRANDAASAEKWYGKAQSNKEKLPPEYAAAVDDNLASLRLRSGTGDMGASMWLDRLASAKDEKEFDQASAAVRKVLQAGKLGPTERGRLTQIMNGLPVEKSRRYAVGALLLESLLAANDLKTAGQIADALNDAFTANEKTIPATESGATLGPAVIHFARGESMRDRGRPTDALVEYETVLSAYPYNEWPDAAACGAAECYAVLGDKATAITKFQEVIAVNPPPPASARWRELAQRRIAELQKEVKP
ncbi:MAG: tetratricopeptide repeat protein [Planctomycetes bacterium]|nr:tetratricopeptide repeat protein [Planctomycetota bacterium]